MSISPMQLAERIYAGTTPDIKPAAKRKLESLVKPIVVLRKMANEVYALSYSGGNANRTANVQGAPASDLIRRLTSLIEYEAYLKKSQQDWETRWENVQELINFASPVMINTEEILHGAKNPERQPSEEGGRDVINLVSDSEDDEQGFSGSRYILAIPRLLRLRDGHTSETPLRNFLLASMLSADVETKDEDKDKDVSKFTLTHLILIH
jgi:ATP-dependent DNA helicase UvrD/PcrA